MDNVYNMLRLTITKLDNLSAHHPDRLHLHTHLRHTEVTLRDVRHSASKDIAVIAFKLWSNLRG